MSDEHSDIRQSLTEFDWTHVYIIYSADVLAESARGIDRMAPSAHILAGWNEDYRPDERVHAVAASEAFTETEDDDNWEFGYLARETNNKRYLGVSDEDEMKCTHCGVPIVYIRETDAWVTWEDGPQDIDRSKDTCDEAGETPHEWPGRGRHRKWVGQLTREQWRAFAGAYCIDLDDNDLPDDFELTMGSLTEYGHLEAISVDTREGWEDYSINSPDVIDSNMYLSFARVDETENEASNAE